MCRIGHNRKIGKTKNGNSVFSVENNSMSMSFGKKLVTLQVTTNISKLVNVCLWRKKLNFHFLNSLFSGIAELHCRCFVVVVVVLLTVIPDGDPRKQQTNAAPIDFDKGIQNENFKQTDSFIFQMEDGQRCFAENLPTSLCHFFLFFLRVEFV